VGGNRIGNRLQHHRLTGFWWGDDQTALAFTDRGHQIDQTWRHVFGRMFQTKTVLRVQRGQFIELDALWILDGFLTVERIDFDEGIELLTVAASAAATTVASATSAAATTTALLVLVIFFSLWSTDTSANHITFAKSVAFDH